MTFQKGHPPYRKAEIDRQPSPPVVTKAARPVSRVAPPPEPVKVVRRRKAKPVRRARAVAQAQTLVAASSGQPQTVRRGLLWAWRERRIKRQEEKRAIEAERIAAKNAARAQIAAAKVENLKEVKVKVKHDFKRPLVMIGGGGLIAVAMVPGYVFATTQATMMGFLCVFLIAGGAAMIYLGKDISTSSNVVRTAGGKKVVYATANSINIYKDRISFEQVEKPLGIPQKLRNDGKFYYVHMEATELASPKARTQGPFTEHNGHTLKAVSVPNTHFFSPREFAEAVTLDCYHAMIKRSVSLLQQLAPWALVAVGGILGILYLTMLSPAPPAANQTAMLGQSAPIYADNTTVAR